MNRINKKIIFILLTILFIFSWGCDIQTTTNSTTTILNVDEVSVDEKNEGLKIVISIEENEITNITKYGLIVRYGNIISLKDMVKKENANNLYVYEVAARECLDNKYSYILKDKLLDNLTNNITIRAYYITQEAETEKMVYGESNVVKKISSLEFDKEGVLGKQIYEANREDKVREVHIVLDTTNYIVSCNENENYIAELKKPFDYDNIITIVTCKEGFIFSDDVKLYVNDIEVTSKFVIDEEGKLIYTIEDPNWTKIY